MPQSKGIISYQLIPIEKLKVDLMKIEASLNFLNNLKTSYTNDWIIFSSAENIRIGISATGIVDISTYTELTRVEEIILLLYKLTKKIISKLKVDASFFVELCITGSDSVGLESLIKQELGFNELKEIGFNLNSTAKVLILKKNSEYTISVRGIDDVNKVIQVYSFITSGKISDLKNYPITQINITTEQTLTKKIVLEV